MSTDKETAIKLGGAKRKNGHKMDCDCHICDNMKNKAKRGGYRKDAEKEELKKIGGSKKKNGHNPNCTCPICKNMRNAKGKTMKAGKGKKSNGHKINCTCPICKNMRKKSKKGGDSEEVAPEEEYEDLDEIPTATTQPVISDEDKKNANSEGSEMVTQPVENNLSSMSATEDELSELSSSRYEPDKSGGRRRKTTRKSMKKSMKKRSNGHKANCGCPICKNMRKGSKTRRR